MPKGVEHGITALLPVFVIGVESLMPKGVEHPLINTSSVLLERVESLMPKGVEHIAIINLPRIAKLRCRISDAERR